MLKIITSKSQFIHERNSYTQDINIGFVPTMGNLHDGHLSLLEKALEEFPVVVFTIFINPKQFGPHEDFKKYPRTLDADIEKIKKTLSSYSMKDVLVFAPSDPQEIFPQDSNLKVSVHKLNSILEGELRPTHFDGVTTVLFYLFKIIRAHKVYLGLKDYQQFIIVKKMIKDLQISMIVEGLPIVRESNGLAMSSRNQYLDEKLRESSSHVYQTLKRLKVMMDFRKENLSLVRKQINTIKNQSSGHWNYLEIVDSETLDYDLTKSDKATIVAAYQQGHVRLLDNVQLEFKK